MPKGGKALGMIGGWWFGMPKGGRALGMIGACVPE